MLKIAIVGCGKIADDHASQLQHIPIADLVAVCDKEPLMAHQLAERFGISSEYTDLSTLLEEVRPDVVHVTTPPQSHTPVARACLEAGAHVYVEKPFALNEREARMVLSLAESRGLKVTVGHDYQFGSAARRARTIIDSGFLGDGPIHMESYFAYPIDRSSYANALLSDREHWVRKLPGQLLHNVISHGIARIAEYLYDESPAVLANGFTSPILRELGECEILDELRVIISDRQRTTAYFTFSSQMRPALHQFRIYGTANGLILDQDEETVIRLSGKKLTSYLHTFVPPAMMAREYLGNLSTNLRSFLNRDLHLKGGQRHLMEEFYHSIVTDGPVPIPYRQILLVARLMDEIFRQVNEDVRASRVDVGCQTAAGVENQT